MIDSPPLRASAIRIAINTRPAMDAGTIPLHLSPVTIERTCDQFAQGYFDIASEPADSEEHDVDSIDWNHYDEAAEAWEQFVASKNYDSYGVGILVGPGRRDVVASNLVAMPNHWRVSWIDGRNRVHLVGDYVHRLSALAVVRALDDADRCPLVITPWTCIDREWNCDRIVESSELNEAVRRAIR